MTTSTEAPPLTPQQIIDLKNQASFSLENPLSKDAHRACRIVLRLGEELLAANARIAELTAAQEWKPTHRDKTSGHVIKVTGTCDGRTAWECESRCVSSVFTEAFSEIYEPLPEPEENP